MSVRIHLSAKEFCYGSWAIMVVCSVPLELRNVFKLCLRNYLAY